MEIFTELNEKYKNLALALGFFDGVHLGHQKVIASAVDFARKNGTKSAVITFKEHPQVYLKGFKPSYILTNVFRTRAFEKLGVDVVYELDFSPLSHLTGEDYIKEVLVKNFAPLSISTGFNHYFGANRTGSPELLEEFSKNFGYKYFKLPPVEAAGEVVSSSLIRKKLENGDIKGANALLGYSFSIENTVQKGAKLASKIGFKTANLNYPAGVVRLPYGVYAVRANGRPGIANFGVKPTFEGLVGEPILEINIFDFDKDIYGEVLRVEFDDFLRPERKFDCGLDLVKQIKSDIIACRTFYGMIDV